MSLGLGRTRAERRQEAQKSSFMQYATLGQFTLRESGWLRDIHPSAKRAGNPNGVFRPTVLRRSSAALTATSSLVAASRVLVVVLLPRTVLLATAVLLSTA
jgi:hypothetical protein